MGDALVGSLESQNFDQNNQFVMQPMSPTSVFAQSLVAFECMMETKEASANPTSFRWK